MEAENNTKMISEVQTEPEQSTEGVQELDNSQSDKKIQEQQDPWRRPRESTIFRIFVWDTDNPPLTLESIFHINKVDHF